MPRRETGKKVRNAALVFGCSVLGLTIFLLSSALAASGLPMPIKKPFVGPIPLEKPPTENIIIKSSFQSERNAIDLVCRRIGNKLASVSVEECLNLGFSATGQSAIGTPILAGEYRGTSPEPPNARVLVLGGTHGDEYSSISVVFKWLAFLKADTRNFHWRITPLLNPDGLLRKNSTRTNGNGVDLNRNLPTPNWLEESHHYWINKTGSNPRRYPGSIALSESENQWLVAEIDSFRPDVIISAHAPHGIVDFDGPPKGPSQIGTLAQRFLGTYPGSLGNYAGLQLGLPVVTIEFKSAGAMPRDAEIERMWMDSLDWLETRFPGPGLDTLRANAAQI